MENMPVKVVCPDCVRGNHKHDSYPDGTGAGCPNLGVPGNFRSQCICGYRAAGIPQKHCPTCRCHS